MPSRRAIRKKMRKRFHPRDVVTWGIGVRSHRVLEVRPTGILVDTRSDPSWEGPQTLFVEFCPPSRSRWHHGPPWHATSPPDEDPDVLSEAVLARRIAEAARRRA